MFGLTYPQLTTLLVGLIAIAAGLVDNWAFGHSFGQAQDLGFLSFGFGLLAGYTVPTVAQHLNER